MTAIALTIAGSDSGGGAGIQADLKTFSALGVYGASVITAVTAQNTRGVSAIHDIPVDVISAQLEAVLSDLNVSAIKIGMLSKPEVIDCISKALSQRPTLPVILDPVMVAASGDPLLVDEAVDTLKAKLIAQAGLITPNLHEAARLLDGEMALSPTAMEEQCDALLEMGAKAVLLKGGHGEGDVSVDLYRDQQRLIWLEAARIETDNTHGTGCTLSSAITAHVAKGQTIADSLNGSKNYITNAIGASNRLQIGSGHGPVHHFWDQWEE